MLKKLVLGASLLSASLVSHAAIITDIVNPTDMAGVTVTATFEDNSQQTLVWSALDAVTGGVDNGDWSFKVADRTFTDFDPIASTVIGAYVLSNNSLGQGIVGLDINAGVAGFYFDTLFGNAASTPGSGPGREFVATDDTVSSLFGDIYSAPDLFGSLNLSWAPNTSLVAGETFSFAADIDRVSVSTPPVLFTFALGLVALAVRKKSLRK